MKKILLLSSSVAIATLLFTGCGAAFNKFVGVPNTKQEMVQMSDDKDMATAFSSFMDQKEDKSLDRTVDVGQIKNGSIFLSAYNFVRFKDGINNDKFNTSFLPLIENSQIVKTYIDVATKRGNKVKAYKGDINLPIFADENSVWRGGDNVSVLNFLSPTYIEFDNNQRFVSVLAHSHDKYYELNNPRGNISIDSKFYIYTGARAKTIQTQLRQKALDESFLYNAN